MRTTIGIAAEETVVRGVVLSSISGKGTRPTVLREVVRPVEDSTAESVAATLDDLAADSESSTRIEDVAVAYRTVAERRALVSRLSSARWRSSSLVSARTALFALLGHIPALDRFGVVLVLEVVASHTSFLVVGPRRDVILASGSWSSGVVDADTAGVAIGRIWSSMDAIGIRPDGVVLCGSSADDPEIVSALRLGLAAPVLQPPDCAAATARGAALVAATALRDLPEPPAADRPRVRRAALVGAAVALLGVAGFTVCQVRDGRLSDAEVRGSPRPVFVPTPQTPSASVPTPVAEQSGRMAEPAPPPSDAPLPTWPGPVPEAGGSPVQTAPSVAREPSASAPPDAPGPLAPDRPPPNTAGGPDGTLLFPGEPPPPPLDAGPAAMREWWDNHWRLTEQWLGGR